MNATQNAAAVSSACWNCSTSTEGAPFCPACRRIQPLPPGADYFTVLGLPRKLQIDVDALEQRFHQASWSLHPDNFVKAGEYERQLSLERSSQLNDSFRTLRDPIARVEYLLGQAGMRKEGQAKQQAPPELLEEVFELNESLDELRITRKAGGDGAETSALKQRLEAAEQNFETKLTEVDAELAGVSSQWDAALDAGAGDEAQKKLMARMNDILNRRSYIRNLVENVKKELTEA